MNETWWVTLSCVLPPYSIEKVTKTHIFSRVFWFVDYLPCICQKQRRLDSKISSSPVLPLPPNSTNPTFQKEGNTPFLSFITHDQHKENGFMFTLMLKHLHYYYYWLTFFSRSRECHPLVTLFNCCQPFHSSSSNNNNNGESVSPEFIRLKLLTRENKQGIIRNTIWLIPSPT